MIIDDPNEYWVWLKRKKALRGVYYCPKSEEEYLEHWGKWLVFDSAAALRSLADKIDQHVNSGEIDSAKFNREPSRVGRGDCVMCIYCDDRDKERVWGILSLFGVSKRIWKYDRQTYQDWKPGGSLYNKAHEKELER